MKRYYSDLIKGNGMRSSYRTLGSNGNEYKILVGKSEGTDKFQHKQAREGMNPLKHGGYL
jgi:hypothetical protein